MAVAEILATVLACCLASQYSLNEREDWEYQGGNQFSSDRMGGYGGRGREGSRPPTPNTVVSGADLSSQHETAF